MVFGIISWEMLSHPVKWVAVDVMQQNCVIDAAAADNHDMTLNTVLWGGDGQTVCNDTYDPILS